MAARRRCLRRSPALAAPCVRHLFAGVERADSFIVDPHKWLFAPFDACALIYRDPALGTAAHTQHAGYLDVVTEDDASGTRPTSPTTSPAGRAGCRSGSRSRRTAPTAYTEAIESTLDGRPGRRPTRSGRRSYLELLREPDLSVVVFRRIGWTPEQYYDWSDRLHGGATTPSSPRPRTTARP